MEKQIKLDYEKFATMCRAKAVYTNLENLGVKDRESFVKGVNMVLRYLKREIEGNVQEQIIKNQ